MSSSQIPNRTNKTNNNRSNKPNKSTKRKSTSTARRLNAVWVFRILGIFILVDVLFLSILFFGFFDAAEKREFGGNTQHFKWEINWNDEVTGQKSQLIDQLNAQEIEHLQNGDYLTITKYKNEDSISLAVDNTDQTVLYIVNRDQTYKVTDLTLTVDTLRTVCIGILIIEGIIILMNALLGVFSIRRRLKSLDQMAFIASELGSRADQKEDDLFNFDEEKVHNLEDAIARITPNGPDCVLHTSDAELKGLELAINGLLERMRASYQQQSRFVSDASHELRTPIAVIQGYVNMLDRWGKKDEKVLEESIEAIKHESEHMKKLVEQLLFLARGDSGRNKFTLEQVNLNEVVKEVYEESLMIDEKHIYHSELNSTAEYVYADVSMLKQAVRILAENAAKYTPEHEQIRIGCGINEQSIPYIYVQDNGIGMKNQDAAHAFERFYRADNARDSKSGGTGLGLSIAKWIVDRHNGYFNVISYEDIGTRISICLPQETIKKEWEKAQTNVG